MVLFLPILQYTEGGGKWTLEVGYWTYKGLIINYL